jgi:hypothetical protein
MSTVPCFWIEPTGRGHIELRRYDNDPVDSCPGGSYHHAVVALDGEVEITKTPEGYIASIDDSIAHDDPRWPTKCENCDRLFGPDDNWQVNQKEHWVRPDTGEIACVSLLEAPPGAMWDATWWRTFREKTYEDGVNLFVMLPDGAAWNVDGPSTSGGGGWARTGDPRAVPPTVSATPSILTPAYHGFLTNGSLIGV